MTGIQNLAGRGIAVSITRAEQMTGKTWDPALGTVLVPDSFLGARQVLGARSDELNEIEPGYIYTHFLTGVPRLPGPVILSWIAFVKEFGSSEQKQEMDDAVAKRVCPTDESL